MAHKLSWSIERSEHARRIVLAVRDEGSREGMTIDIHARGVGALVASLRLAIDEDPAAFESEFLTEGNLEVVHGAKKEDDRS